MDRRRAFGAIALVSRLDGETKHALQDEIAEMSEFIVMLERAKAAAHADRLEKQ